MANSLRDRLNGVPRKPLAMKGEGVRLRGETPLKNLETDARMVGRVLADAVLTAKLTNQEAADRLGIHPSMVSRWKNGGEVPAMLVRWIADPVMRQALILALADIPDDDVIVERTIRVGRSA